MTLRGSSGSEAQKYKDRALEKGAIAFFTKPVDDKELLELIEKTIGAPPPPAASTGAAKVS